MEKDLKNQNHFAVLTSAQQDEVNQIAQTIPVDKEMKKKIKAVNYGFDFLGPFKTGKKLITEQKEMLEKRKEFNKKYDLTQNKSINELSEKEIVEAIGEIAKNIIGLVPVLIVPILPIIILSKKGLNKTKAMLLSTITYIVTVVPLLLLEIKVTKEQKKLLVLRICKQ